MTYETCERLADHFEKLGDEEQAKMYRERAERKKAKLGIVDNSGEKKAETKSKGKK